MSTTRETLKSFFNQKVGSTTSTSLSYNLDNEAGENISLNDDQDLGEYKDQDGNNQKLLGGFLGDYFKFLTEQSHHLFKPPAGNQKIFTVKRGDSVNTANSDTTLGAEYFVNNSNKKIELDKISLSDYFRTGIQNGVDQSFPVDKTGGDSEKSGHKVLSDIEGTGLNTSGDILSGNENNEENKALNLIQNYLKDNNRFSNVAPELPYTAQPDFENNREILTNNTFGKYEKEKYKTSFEQLKKLGAQLLGNTAGFRGDTLGISNKIVDDSFQKQSGDSYRAIKSGVYPKDESGQKIRQGSGHIVDGNNEGTVGTTYTPNMEFYGKNKRIHKLHALIAAKGIYIIYNNVYAEIFEDLTEKSEVNFQEIKKQIQQDLQTATWSDAIYGRSKNLSNLKLDAKRSKYLIRTIYPYKDCVDRGLELCLGPNDVITDNTVRIGGTTDNIDDLNPIISNSPGYWLAICTNVLRNVSNSLEVISTVSEDTNQDAILRELMYSVSKSPLIRFFNAMATVGDVSLRSTMGNTLDTPIDEIKAERPFDIDELEDLPGNRVGKSRMKSGRRINQLIYAQNNVPSMYILPVNAVRASVTMDKGPKGANILRTMMGSELVENTYLDINNDGPGSRIPNEVTKVLEDKLEAEYVPFYIQDLRTNEIISFHAFLSSLTDQISPQFNSEAGYGRLDDVHIYNSTKRTVSCAFTLMATSREDFDSMWFKINKITTLLYPQWTQGTMVGNKKTGTFIQPFSQVIGASPIVRLRIGDVIKSNYSRFNFGRIFGIGDQGVNPKVQSTGIDMVDNVMSGFDTFAGAASEVALKTLISAFGSPVAASNFTGTNIIKNKGGMLNKAVSAATEQISLLLKNGFVNPLAFDPVNNQITDPKSNFKALLNPFGFGYTPTAANAFASTGDMASDAVTLSGVGQQALKSNMVNGYLLNDTGERLYISRPITVQVRSKIDVESMYADKKRRIRTGYKCILTDPSLLGTEYHGKEISCLHEDILPIPDAVFANTTVLPGLAALATGPITAAANSAGTALKKIASEAMPNYLGGASVANAAIDLAQDLLQTNETKFMLPENNPFVRGMETTMGRGLAGKLGGITFDWISEFPWETDYNARAPMGVKISFSLDVIHDLPPGLDNSGFNRAPLYNVGNIMKGISSDVYSDDGVAGEANYNLSKIIKKG